MPTWTYDPAAHTYQKDGEPLSAADLRALRDSFLEERKAGTADLASRLASGDLTLGAWESGMREHVKATFVAEAAFGKGGREQMTQADWGRTGSQIKGSYTFLRGFAEHIATGELSEAQIKARAGMYVESASQAYEQARARSYGELDLPQVPSDGATICGASCRCGLSITEDEDAFNVWWQLGASDRGTCPDCEELAGSWNPLVVPKDTARALNGNGRTHAHA